MDNEIERHTIKQTYNISDKCDICKNVCIITKSQDLRINEYINECTWIAIRVIYVEPSRHIFHLLCWIS